MDKETKDKLNNTNEKTESITSAAPETERPETAAAEADKSRVVDKKVLEQKRKKRILRRRIILLAAVIIVIAAVLIVLWKTGVFKKKDPDKVLAATVIPVEYTPRGEYILSAVDGVVIICDENGVTGIDGEGKWKWNSTLSAFAPVFSGAGNMILVTDQGGRSVWAFDGSGLLWRYITDTDLICAYVADPVSGRGNSSGSGASDIILICEQEDFESSVTLLGQSKGKLSEKFTRKFGKYHMLSAAGSSDRSQVAASGVYFEGGTLSGCTVFLKASDGEVYSTIVSDGNVYLQLRYLSDGTLFAANSDSLRLIRKMPSVTGSGDTEKELWARSGDRKLIADTCAVDGSRFAAAFSDGNVSDGGGMSEIRYYDRSGDVTKSVEIRGSVKGLKTCSGFLCAFTDKTVYLINRGGNIIGSQDFDPGVNSASFMDSKTLAVDTPSGIFVLSFGDQDK